MPVIVGHDKLASIPEERITDKITRKVMSGKQGMMVWWHFKAGGHAAAHKHPHEQISWMIKGRMDLRIGDEMRSMVAGDIAVIPGGVEHEAFFPEGDRDRRFLCAGARGFPRRRPAGVYEAGVSPPPGGTLAQKSGVIGAGSPVSLASATDAKPAGQRNAYLPRSSVWVGKRWRRRCQSGCALQ